MITPAQIRMARAALGWSVRELAAASKIGTATISRFESGRGGVLAETLDRLQSTLQKKGIIFLSPGDTRDGGPGVRFKK